MKSVMSKLSTKNVILLKDIEEYYIVGAIRDKDIITFIRENNILSELGFIYRSVNITASNDDGLFVDLLQKHYYSIQDIITDYISSGYQIFVFDSLRELFMWSCKRKEK